MKVIGENKKEYIITATKDEIANLQGLYDQYNKEFRIEVGDDINIHEFYVMAREAKFLHIHSGRMKEAVECINKATSIIDFVTKNAESEE